MPEDTFRWAVTIGVAIATLSVFTTAVVSILFYRVAAKLRVKIEGVTERVEPLIDTVRKLADENAPKIGVFTSNVVDISANAKDVSVVAKDQAHRFAEVGRDLADRTKAQIARVDAVVDETVEHVQHAGENVKASVMKPVREASAVLAGVRAAVSTLVDGRRPTVDHVTQDEEMFI
jgi:methyl-accepting chemotaxis protein